MSNERKEQSESGDPIYRHAARESEWTAPQHHGENLEAIEAHVEKHIGKIETVFHEVASDLIHLDVLFVPATPERPYHVLATCGVSEEPMRVPEGMEAYRRVELLIALPPSWPLTQESFKSEANYWPVRWLKMVGRLPHEHKTWIGWGHTVPNSDPPERIADTEFVGVMLTPPYAFPNEFFQIKPESGDPISFYMLTPLFREEMDMKLSKGADEIEERFEKRGIGFVLDTQRANVAKARRWLW